MEHLVSALNEHVSEPSQGVGDVFPLLLSVICGLCHKPVTVSSGMLAWPAHGAQER